MDLVNHIISNIVAAATPLGGVLYLLTVTALVDVGSGIWAAVKSDTFDMAYVDTFLKSHILQKWGPIMGTLLGGIAIGGTDNVLGAAIIAGGVAQIVAYEAATLASAFGIGSPQKGNLKDAADETKGLPSSVAPISGPPQPS